MRRLTLGVVADMLANVATAPPWRVRDNTRSRDVVDADGNLIANDVGDDAPLFAAAPDLAADLLDAHAALATERERAEAAVTRADAAEAECARLRESEADAARLFESVRYQRDAASTEAAALRAIVEGRTVAPTAPTGPKP